MESWKTTDGSIDYNNNANCSSTYSWWPACRAAGAWCRHCCESRQARSPQGRWCSEIWSRSTATPGSPSPSLGWWRSPLGWRGGRQSWGQPVRWHAQLPAWTPARPSAGGSRPLAVGSPQTWSSWPAARAGRVWPGCHRGHRRCRRPSLRLRAGQCDRSLGTEGQDAGQSGSEGSNSTSGSVSVVLPQLFYWGLQGAVNTQIVVFNIIKNYGACSCLYLMQILNITF